MSQRHRIIQRQIGRHRACAGVIASDVSCALLDTYRRVLLYLMPRRIILCLSRYMHGVSAVLCRR